MGLFEMMEEHEHEQLSFCHFGPEDLRAIIAIHNTKLGPAVGGCRLWHYRNEDEAIADALNLSRIMTHQAAISQTDFGGGKIVLWHDDVDELPGEAYFRAVGRFIESFDGKIITYPDLGTDSREMRFINRETEHVMIYRVSPTENRETAEIAALGVYWCIKACIKYLYGRSDLKGLRAAVQGVGSVGSRLVELLKSEDVQLVITDLNYDAIKRVQDRYPDTIIVRPDEILEVECDVLCPCATGPIIFDENIEKLRCKVIAGAAYNIMAKRRTHFRRLHEMGILAAPDFVTNSGEMFLTEYTLQILSEEEARNAVKRIYDAMASILAHAKKKGISPYEAALEIARERIRSVGRVKGILC